MNIQCWSILIGGLISFLVVFIPWMLMVHKKLAVLTIKVARLARAREGDEYATECTQEKYESINQCLGCIHWLDHNECDIKATYDCGEECEHRDEVER